jgi:hypothetical protein
MVLMRLQIPSRIAPDTLPQRSATLLEAGPIGLGFPAIVIVLLILIGVFLLLRSADGR